MELKKLSQHIWYMPFEQERDRPNLGYVKGKNWSLAIDAGHSAAHTKEFYSLLEKEGLPLPSITVFTHWHWDHTFGMHAVNGLTLANEKTNRHLAEWKNKIEKNGPAEFFALHVKVIQSEAPHTDDSTLVYIENDKTLFVGDATGDDFFTGIKDAALSKKLADTIRLLNPQICMEGHWVPVETDDTLNDLLSGV